MKKNAFLLIGDPFLTEEKEKVLFDAVQREFPQEISRETIRLSEAGLSSVLSKAKTLPFWTSAQWLRIWEISELDENDVKVLSEYLDRPVASSFLLFFAASLDDQPDFYRLMEKKGEVFVLGAGDKRSMTSFFIRKKMKTLDREITEGARKRLEEQAGDMPVFLDSMINQLVAYAGDKKVIDESMLDLFEEDFSKVDAFKLVHVITAKKTAEALALLKKFLEENDKDLVSFVGLLHWQLRRLWQARLCLQAGESEDRILKKFKISAYQSGLFIRQVKGLSCVQIEKAIENLFRLDWRVKTGAAEGPSALERWVVEMSTA